MQNPSIDILEYVKESVRIGRMSARILAIVEDANRYSERILNIKIGNATLYGYEELGRCCGLLGISPSLSLPRGLNRNPSPIYRRGHKEGSAYRRAILSGKFNHRNDAEFK
jgi:hypothetical protein